MEGCSDKRLLIHGIDLTPFQLASKMYKHQTFQPGMICSTVVNSKTPP